MFDLTTLDEIKAQMPVTYVLHKRGHEPEDRKGRDLLYPVPWREDNNPSLACYPDEDDGIVDRWSDTARKDGGDILDLIGKLDPKLSSFDQRLNLAKRLFVAYQEDDWEAPQPLASKGSFDVEAARAEMNDWHIKHDNSSLTNWLGDREDYLHGISAQWLRQTFGVSWVRGELKAPYGGDGLYKYRKPGEKFQSPAGTRGMWTFFYGEDLDDGERPVVLLESETDVWSGTHATQDYVFFGLPTGAGTRPEKMQTRLAGRRILLGFDGDTAGRDASILWATYLSKNNQVEIIPVDGGQDLSEVADIPGLLKKARPFEVAIPGLMVINGRYHRQSKSGADGAPVADFELTPLRVLHSPEGGLSYEVTDGRHEYLVLSSDLLTKNSFHRWAHDRGLVWSGSDTDVAVLASRLKSTSIFCPSESAADIAGLHENHFVWDGGSIGDRPVRFVPTAAKVNLDIRLSTDKADARLIYAMREMNDHRITDPVLAWTAAAPFRSLMSQFPILNVAGTSGSGKTTTVQAIIPTLTGSHIFQTLSSSTPYAVESIINSTNGFPVVFDEYRPGARDASLLRLEQLARDAYDGQPSAKSAGGDKWNELAYIRTLAPIVIAGEQSITEISHAERMVLVHIVRPQTRDSKHLRALKYVKANQDGTLAHSFLSHVVDSVQAGGRLEHKPRGPESLPDRVRYNLGVLDLGWRILNDFLNRHGFGDMKDPDWSGIIDTTKNLTSTNPTIEALIWAIGDEYASRNVWVSDNELIVNAAGFVSDVKRSGVFMLPGNNARTITDQLQADYGATQATRRPPLGDTRKRVWVMDAESVIGNAVN